MFEISADADFSSGHYLRNYQGKCEHPHGHNYKVRVTLMGEELDEAGMLLDFKLLKQAMHPVLERLDHTMINELEPFTTVNPSAENLAKHIFEQTAPEIARLAGPRVRVKECTVWETDLCFATYFA